MKYSVYIKQCASNKPIMSYLLIYEKFNETFIVMTHMNTHLFLQNLSSKIF